MNATVMLRNVLALTDVIVGAPGATGRATTMDDGADGGPEPTRLSAVTVHRYLTAAVRPATVIGGCSASRERMTAPRVDVHPRSSHRPGAAR